MTQNFHLPLPDAHGAAKNALERAVAQPTTYAQANQSTDLTTRGIAPMDDVMPSPSPNSGFGSGIFTLPASIAGIAFTGFLAPGDLCLLGPSSIVSDISNRFNQDNHSVPIYGWVGLVNWLLASIGAVTFDGSSSFPSGCFLLRPGEAMDFGRVLGDGLVGTFINTGPRRQNIDVSGLGAALWPPTYPANTGSILAGAATPPPFVSGNRIVGPTSRPLIRVFRESGCSPRNVEYTKVPWVDFAPISSLSTTLPNNQRSAWYPQNTLFGAVGGGGGTPVILPVGSDFTTISLNTQNQSSLPTNAYAFSALADSGVGAFNVNVYWLLSDGIWHNNPADNWTSTGRGQASSSHDVEVYQTPKNAIGVTLTIDGTWINPNPAVWQFYYFVMCTEL